ncbi:N-acetylmuramoyl-L-alanine amidase [Desulforamulus putei DSM 12395]|uniref:Spore cortex-lytic enzyme n=1 Tax=Desulforamulus putei DSM 12395 TaxID=1121429 RepID=A0A1M4XXZ3_9FIRM|nr:N-acetylmuramoyl-L-alanine amidase [Desulforamulus putei DSM 12395]
MRAVQQRLKDWGYYTGPVDGYYSGQTAAAVRKFQARNGLRVDGVVGPQTYQALGLYTPPQRTTYTTTSRGFISNRDAVNLLARVIMGEAADEPYIGKVAVGAVLLNRVRNSQFPNTLAGVVYQPLAFESVANGQYNRPLSPEAIRAAQDALAGYDPTGGALFFWNPSKPVSRWIWSRRIISQIGNHVFAH